MKNITILQIGTIIALAIIAAILINFLPQINAMLADGSGYRLQ